MRRSANDDARDKKKRKHEIEICYGLWEERAQCLYTETKFYGSKLLLDLQEEGAGLRCWTI